MPDYGLQMLTSMYSGPSKMEKNQMELSKLQQMQAFYEKQAKQKEENALKMQMYDESVSKFADTLLGADRNRVYEKARVLKSSIRDMIKQNGGDMKAFFANGGHDVMAQYKSSVIQSEESSQYLDNKQNMAFILKAMNEGKSHLLSPTDKANFDNYFKNNGGKLTYSGMMNEIKMPDPSKYKYGQNIPIQDILNENRLAILSNYSTYYKGGDNDPATSGKIPSEADLLAFTASMYGTSTGSNYQEQISRNNQSIALNQELRAQQQHPLDMAAKDINNQQGVANVEKTYQDMETAKINAMLEQQKAMGGGDGSGGSGGGKGTDYDMFPDQQLLDATGEKKVEYNQFTELGPVLNSATDQFGYHNVGNYTKNLFKDNPVLKNITDGVWSDSGAKQYNYSGKGGGLFNGDWIASQKGFNNGWVNTGNFTPAVKYKVFKNPQQKDAYMNHVATNLLGQGVKYENGVIKNFTLRKGMPGVYSADGSSLREGHNTLSGEAEFDEERYSGDWKVNEVILTSKIGDKLLMNRNGVLASANMTKGNQGRMTTVAAMTNKNTGARVYVEVDPNDMMQVKGLQAPLDVTSATNQSNIKSAKIGKVIGQDKANKANLNRTLNAYSQNNSFRSAAKMISSGQGYGDSALLHSFYLLMTPYSKTAQGQQMTDNQVADLQSNKLLSMLGPDMIARLKSGQIAGNILFDELEKNQSGSNLQMIKEWRNIYNEIKHNR